jgi:hypothetical protein
MQDYASPRYVIWVLLILLLAPLLMLLSKGSFGIPAWGHVVGAYVMIGAGAVFFEWKARKAFGGPKGGNTRSFEMMMDREKIYIQEGATEITVRLEEITEIGEFKGYIMVRKGAGTLTGFPKEQLLAEELRLLDEAKNRL